MAARIDNKRAASFNQGTRRSFRWIASCLRKTLTVDNGKEFTNFKGLESLLEADVYFTDPYSSWHV